MHAQLTWVVLLQGATVVLVSEPAVLLLHMCTSSNEIIVVAVAVAVVTILSGDGSTRGVCC